MERSPRSYSCRTCHAPLNRYDSTVNGVTTSTYIHPPGTALDGHEPDPVHGGVVEAAQSVCDVCSGPRPVWIYPTSGQVTTVQVERDPKAGKPSAELTLNDLDEGWAICQTCARLVEAHDVKGMVKRALVTNPSMRAQRASVPPLMRQQAKQRVSEMLTEMYQAFFATRTGPREPMPERDGPTEG